MSAKPAGHCSVFPSSSHALDMAEFCIENICKGRHLGQLQDEVHPMRDGSIDEVRSRAAAAPTGRESVHHLSKANAVRPPASAAAAAVICEAKQPPEGSTTGKSQGLGKMQCTRPQKRTCSAAELGAWCLRTRQGAKQCSEQLPAGTPEQPDCGSAEGAPQQGNGDADVPTPCRQDSTALKTLANIALKM